MSKSTELFHQHLKDGKSEEEANAALALQALGGLIPSLKPREPLTLGEQQAEAIQQTHALLHKALNTPMKWVDGNSYTVTFEKQMLLNARISMYNARQQLGIPFQAEWNATGQECVTWELENLFALGMAIEDYVSPIAGAQRHAEVLIRAAKKPEKIEVILNDYQAQLDVLTG